MVPRRVSGPCLPNVVWGGKTPEVDLRDADDWSEVGFCPRLLLTTIYGACARTRRAQGVPSPPDALYDGNVSRAFRRFGADGWDASSIRFRDPNPTLRTAAIGR